MGEASNGMTGKLDGETFDRGRFDGLKFGRERKDRKVYLFTNTHTHYIYISLLSIFLGLFASERGQLR